MSEQILINRRDDPQFKYPVDLQKCIKHRLATRIWRGKKDAQYYTQICQCCDRKVGQQEVQHSCRPNSSQFSFLGPGIPLFFKFVKYSATLLVLFTLVFSIYALYTNIKSKNCQYNENCVLTVFNSLSIVNKKSEYYLLRMQNYTLLAFVLCCYILLHVFRYRFRETQKNIDKKNDSASDYSIIIQRLPQSSNIDSIKMGIITMIKNQIQVQKFNFKKDRIEGKTPQTVADIDIEEINIVISQNVTSFLQQKQTELDEYKKFIEQKKDSDSEFQFASFDPPKELGQIAIVVFPEQKMKDYFIVEPNFLQKLINYFFPAFPPLSDIRINGKLVSIERAPEPEDIMWENAHITPWERTIRKILLNIASFMLLIAGGACQYGLALWQTNIEDPRYSLLIGTIASICVTVTNNILTNFLILSTDWQRMGTQSQYLEVLTSKLSIQQFLNSGVFVVGANVLANFNDSILENNLADTITQIMIINAIVPNLTVLLLNYSQIVGRIKRFIFLSTGFFIKTQLQANHLYELPKPDFTEKYSYIVKTLWLTAFYAPFVPIVAPISAIGLTLKYFIEKFLFSRSYSIADKISSSLNKSCMEALEYIPLIFSIGQFLIFIYLQTFFQQAPEDWMIPIYVCLGLSLLNIVLPMEGFNQSIQEFFNGLSQKKDTLIQSLKPAKSKKIKSYKQAINSFQITYEMTLPTSNMKKKKKRDTLFKMFKPIDEIFNAQVEETQKIALSQANRILPMKKILEEKSQLHEEDGSKLNLKPEDTSYTSSLIKENIQSTLKETSIMTINRNTSEKEDIVMFSTVQSTRPNESVIGSVCDIPAKGMSDQPEPGRLLKKKDQYKQVIQSSQEVRKLFNFYNMKKLSNNLIEIREQQNDEQQKTAHK